MTIALLDRYADRRRNRRQGLTGGPHLLDRIHAEPKPPPEWERALREFSPISEHQQWLHFRMWPTKDLKDARWVLYAMTPVALITDQTKIAQLEGRPWWELPMEERAGRQAVCSSYQWEMYRQHKAWARPYWCVQGTKGGTPMQYTPYEAAILKAHGKTRDVPEVGSLPWADFDSRAVVAITGRDRMRKFGDRFNALLDRQKAAADVQAEDDAAERAYRAEFLKYFEEQMAPNGDYIAWHSNKSENQGDFRPATKAETEAASRWQEHFLEFGKIPSTLSPET